MKRFQIITNVFVLLFLVINFGCLYHLTSELQKANDKMENIRTEVEAVQDMVVKVKIIVSDVERAVAKVADSNDPVNDILDKAKEKLEDVIKDFENRIK